MLRARGQWLLRRLSGITIFGDGMLERVRSGSLALLAANTAVGLAMVAFVLQLGWPIGLNEPLPSTPLKRPHSVGAAIVAAAPPRPSAALRNSGPGVVRARAVEPGVKPARSDLDEGRDLVVSNSEPTGPPSNRHPQGHQNAPQGQPAPAPQAPQAPQGAAQAPQGAAGTEKPEQSARSQPSPVPQHEPPPERGGASSQVATNGNAYGKSNGNGPPVSSAAVGNPHGEGTGPGHSGPAPGHSGPAPGQSGDAPGQSGDAPGHSGDAPGHSGD